MKPISLLYHDVVCNGDFASSGFSGGDADLYKLEAGQFDEHLAAIQARSGRSIRLVTEDHRPGSLYLTFDDGGASGSKPIADLLERRGWRGHFFIPTDFIGKPSFLTEDQIRALHQRGHLVGSHSCSHPARISHCLWDDLVREWQASEARLAEIIGHRVTVASVPGGYYSKRVAKAAALAGFKFLFTSEPTRQMATVDGCLVLGRFSITRGTLPGVAASYAEGRRLACWRQKAAWTSKKLAKAVAGNLYVRVRKSILNAGTTPAPGRSNSG